MKIGIVETEIDQFFDLHHELTIY